MRRGVADGTVMPEHHQFARGHLPAGGRAVVVEHVLQRRPEQGEVVVRKAGPPRQMGTDEAMGAIEAIGHDMLAAHGADVVLARLFLGRGHAGDRDFERHDRVDRGREGQLDRAADLAGVRLGGHHRTEGADVEEIGAHPGGHRARLLLLLGQLLRLGFDVERLVGPFVLLVQIRALPHVNLMAGRAAGDHVDKITHLALQADIGHQPLIGLGVEPRQVAGIRVAIGVTVGDVEEIDEIIAVADRGHGKRALSKTGLIS